MLDLTCNMQKQALEHSHLSFWQVAHSHTTGQLVSQPPTAVCAGDVQLLADQAPGKQLLVPLCQLASPQAKAQNCNARPASNVHANLSP